MEIIVEEGNIVKPECNDNKENNIYILQRLKNGNTESWYFDNNIKIINKSKKMLRKIWRLTTSYNVYSVYLDIYFIFVDLKNIKYNYIIG